MREELKRLGATFRSDSDTEVILEAYKQWGESCLECFNAMFAFAIYDSVTEKLFCARDRFRENPFCSKRERISLHSPRNTRT